MPLPDSFISVTVADNTKKSNGQAETGNYRAPITPVTAANYTAVTGNVTALIVAIEGITIGRTVRRTVESATVQIAYTPATDPLAQRENKWLVRYHDSVNGQKFNVSLPCADLSLHMANSEFLDISAGVGGTFKTAFEAVVVSPNDSAHSVVVDSVQFVGRNS